jgi:hypothetical protein
MFALWSVLRIVVLGVVLITPALAFAADPQPSLAEMLSRPLLERDRPLHEVQHFCESRVPIVPRARSVAEWEQIAQQLRKNTLEKIVFRGEAAAWRDAKTRVEWLETLEIPSHEKQGAGYRIRKCRFEALPGLWIPALLYEPTVLEGRVPVVLNVNGHNGASGKAEQPKQIRCINLAKRGMLALNVEWLGMGQLSTSGNAHYKINQIDLCGTSGVAVHCLSLMRGLDVLLAHAHADPGRVAVAGLSGGGWQTIFISALDPRVTLANPVAGYSSFRTRAQYPSDLGDSEQTPVDLATIADYAHLTALLAPRAALLTYNAEDKCCFKADHALPPLVEAAAPVYELYGKRNLFRTHVNHVPGTHNFEVDNRQAFYRMIGDVFFTGQAVEYSHAEIECAQELKSIEELNVPLPENNKDIHTLALELSERIAAEKPPTFDEHTARERLAEVVRADHLDLQAISVKREETAEVVATWWWLRIGGEWTVPALELAPTKQPPTSTVLLLGDEGRAKLAAEAKTALEDGSRVLAFDPYNVGESKSPIRDFLHAMLVSAVGERPVGIQASQTAAIARWIQDRDGQQKVRVIADGPQTSLAALVAAALESRAITSVELRRSCRSLREVIANDRPFEFAPSLFCFGLLKEFDIPRIVELAGNDRVKFVEPAKE